MITRRWFLKIAIAGFVAALVPPMATGRTIQTSGWSAGALQVGDVITIEGKFAFNPQTRQPTTHLREFVITAVTSSDDFEIRPR